MSCKFDTAWGLISKQEPETEPEHEAESEPEPDSGEGSDETNIDVKLKQIDSFTDKQDVSLLYSIKTLKSFEKFKSKESGMIVVYANWCKICHHSSQDVLNFMKKTTSELPQLKFAVVDCSKKNDIMTKYKIIGVPMYFICHKQKLYPMKLGTSALKAFSELKKIVQTT